MEPNDPVIQALLDQSWMEAETRLQDLMTIGSGSADMNDPTVQAFCIKACAMVGMEAEQRKLRREAEQASQE